MNASNVTQIVGNRSEHVSDEVVNQPWGRYGGIMSVTAIIILTGEMLTFYGMAKLRKIPFATKFLICLNQALDCCWFLMILAAPITLIFGLTDTVSYYGRQVGKLVTAGSWLCLAMLSIERFVCIAYPNEYIRYVSKRRVVCASLASLAILWTLKLSARYLIIPAIYQQLNVGYSFDITNGDILTCILGTCMIVCLLCNGQVMRIVNHHKKKVLAQASTAAGGANDVKPLQGFRSTNVVWILNAIFIILYLPLLLIKMIRINSADSAVLRSVEFGLMLITCVANPIVYAWRLREFRYHILALFGRCNKRIALFAERERLEVYCITTKAMTPNGNNDLPSISQ